MINWELQNLLVWHIHQTHTHLNHKIQTWITKGITTTRRFRNICHTRPNYKREVRFNHLLNNKSRYIGLENTIIEEIKHLSCWTKRRIIYCSPSYHLYDINKLLSGIKEIISTGTPINSYEKLILWKHTWPVHDHEEYYFSPVRKFTVWQNFVFLWRLVSFILSIYIYIYTSHDFMYVFANINCTTRLLVMDILFTYLPGYDWGTIICFYNRLFFSEILFLKKVECTAQYIFTTSYQAVM